MSGAEVVHVVDDDEAVRRSLAFLLDSAGLRPRTFGSASEFLAALSAVEAGCVVSDIRMPGMDGIELLKRVKQARPELPVVMMTGHGDVPLAVEAMKAGAADFVEKPFEDDLLLAAIRAALAIAASARERSAEIAGILECLETLSPRERDVFNGVVSGKPNKVIAFDLGISPRTVEIYRANLMEKMKAGAVSDLVRKAMLAGVTPP